MMLSIKTKFIYAAIFAIAMALLEAAVVVYLRQLYYPEGFAPPFKPIPYSILFVEISREAATIIMIFLVACFAAEKAPLRFAWFIYLFGIWDIFYYVWLKVFLNWPASLLDWDLLFLIPLPWMAPVLAPVLISLGLVLGAVLNVLFDRQRTTALSSIRSILLMFAGAIVIILSFTLNSSFQMQEQFPDTFNWPLFLFGSVLAAVGFLAGLGLTGKR